MNNDKLEWHKVFTWFCFISVKSFSVRFLDKIDCKSASAAIKMQQQSLTAHRDEVLMVAMKCVFHNPLSSKEFKQLRQNIYIVCTGDQFPTAVYVSTSPVWSYGWLGQTAPAAAWVQADRKVPAAPQHHTECQIRMTDTERNLRRPSSRCVLSLLSLPWPVCERHPVASRATQWNQNLWLRPSPSFWARNSKFSHAEFVFSALFRSSPPSWTRMPAGGTDAGHQSLSVLRAWSQRREGRPKKGGFKLAICGDAVYFVLLARGGRSRWRCSFLSLSETIKIRWPAVFNSVRVCVESCLSTWRDKEWRDGWMWSTSTAVFSAIYALSYFSQFICLEFIYFCLNLIISMWPTAYCCFFSSPLTFHR